MKTRQSTRREFGISAIEAVAGLAFVGGIGWGLTKYLQEFDQRSKRILEKLKPMLGPTTRPAKPNEIDKQRLYATLTRHEGKKDLAYNDSRGNRTIGIGFNLERTTAKQSLENLGLNYSNVYAGKQALSETQINTLLEEDVNKATEDARKYIGKDFDDIPAQAKEVVINMSYNLGLTRLSKFKKLRLALLKKDYASAADEMKDSRWHHQVGRRSRELVKTMRSLKK